MRLLFLFLSFIAFKSLYAQNSNYILGTIIDNKTNKPIQGVTVIITNAYIGSVSDQSGKFVLEANNKEKHSLTVAATGYKTLDTIFNPNTYNKDLGILLSLQEDEDKLLKEVVVYARSGKKESISSIYITQKNSASISDGISADLIKKSPDKNTSDVLKRVGGTTIQDNKFVIIRGLSERYNSALLNNAILPSTEPDKKAFAFNIIPAAAVENIIIYKSATPDLPGDFAGGAIKITTKEYPNKKLSELSLSLGYNANTTFKLFKKSINSGKYDAIGFLDDSRNMPSEYYDMRKSFINQGNDYKKTTTQKFSNSYGVKDDNHSLPNFSLSYTGGNTTYLKKGNQKIGYIYTLGYGKGRQIKNYTLSEYELKTNIYNYNTIAYEEKNNINALVNVNYAYNDYNTISFKSLFNNDLSLSNALRNGLNTMAGDLYYKSVLNEVKQDGILNTVFEGNHKLLKNYVIDWNISYALTYRNEPDQKILSFTSRDAKKFERKLSNENSPAIQDAGRVYNNLYENIFGADISVTKKFDWLGYNQKLKIGTANYFRLKNVEVNALGYATIGGYGTLLQEATGNNPFDIFTNENIDTYNLTIANIGSNSTSYEGRALLNAAFVMLENKFSEKIKLAWGARLENYRQELLPNDNASNIILKEKLDLLPSGILTYSFNSKTNFRLAASQSVNRPEFRELASYSLYDYTNDLIYKGNPNLERALNTNVDFKYEYFPNNGEIISAGLFYKYFDKPIEQINQGNAVMSYDNANYATSYGLEIEIRKNLSFLSYSLKNFTFSTNFSYIDGNVQMPNIVTKSLMQGQSNYIVNTGINYTGKIISANVLFNKIGPRIAFRGQGSHGMDIYENSRNVLDAQISKKFFRNALEVKLTISDILNEDYMLYYKYDKSNNLSYNSATDKITRLYNIGTSANISLKYNF